MNSVADTDFFFEKQAFLNKQDLFDNRIDEGVAFLTYGGGNLNHFPDGHALDDHILMTQSLMDESHLFFHMRADLNLASLHEDFGDCRLFFSKRHDEVVVWGLNGHLCTPTVGNATSPEKAGCSIRPRRSTIILPI